MDYYVETWEDHIEKIKPLKYCIDIRDGSKESPYVNTDFEFLFKNGGLGDTIVHFVDENKMELIKQEDQ